MVTIAELLGFNKLKSQGTFWTGRHLWGEPAEFEGTTSSTSLYSYTKGSRRITKCVLYSSLLLSSLWKCMKMQALSVIKPQTAIGRKQRLSCPARSPTLRGVGGFCLWALFIQSGAFLTSMFKSLRAVLLKWSWLLQYITKKCGEIKKKLAKVRWTQILTKSNSCFITHPWTCTLCPWWLTTMWLCCSAFVTMPKCLS